MKTNIEKVSIVKCSSYRQAEVDAAIKRSLKMIDFDFAEYRGKKVLIKPNIVSTEVKHPKATITHPSLLEAVCKILKENKCEIFIGESSFTNTVDTFKKSGFDGIVKKYGAKKIIFEQSKLIRIKNSNARILYKFPVAKIVKDADLIINLPKLKTHQLTKYTGAIKNLYGLIPGGLKQRMHKKAPGERKFSQLLIDIYQNIKPQLNIMDAVVGMEGAGPTGGEPKRINLILASKNSVALDIASCKVIGLKPKKIFAIRYAIKRKIYPNYDFELVGMKKIPEKKFKKAPGDKITLKTIRNFFRLEKPIICDEKKCIRCGTCAKHCPQKAITLKLFPIIDRRKCIRCFCCMEICPKHALSLK